MSRIMYMYHSLKKPAKASIWFLICAFLQKGISLLTTPLFTRLMTEYEYGRYSVYNSWFGIAQIIVSLNLSAGVYTRGLIKNEDDQERFSSSLLGLTTAFVLVWTVVYLCFQDTVNSLLDLSTMLMLAMMLDIWATAAYQFWSNKERTNYRYKQLVVLTLVYSVLRPIVSFVAVANATEASQAESRIVVSTLLSVILFSGLFISMVRKGKVLFQKKYWVYALKFNLPLIPHYLSQIVLGQSDRIMIGRICGANDAAYYSVAYTLSMVLNIFCTSISGTMNPWIYRALAKREYEKIKKVTGLVLWIVAAGTVLFIACGPEVLVILAPSSYQSAVWVIPPVTASVYFMFLYNLFATFEFHYEKTSYVMYASVIGAVVNLILNSIFIPRYGFVAAGYTTLFCYILYSGAHYCFMKIVIWKNIGHVRVYSGRTLVGIGVLVIILSGAMMTLYTFTLLRYSILCVGTIALFVKRKRITEVVGIIKDKG